VEKKGIAPPKYGWKRAEVAARGRRSDDDERKRKSAYYCCVSGKKRFS
jgi:hypothetical protein